MLLSSFQALLSAGIEKNILKANTYLSLVLLLRIKRLNNLITRLSNKQLKAKLLNISLVSRK